MTVPCSRVKISFILLLCKIIAECYVISYECLSNSDPLYNLIVIKYIFRSIDVFYSKYIITPDARHYQQIAPVFNGGGLSPAVLWLR